MKGKGGALVVVVGIATILSAGFYLYKEGFFKNLKHVIRSGTSSGGATKEITNYYIAGSAPAKTALSTQIAGNPDQNTGTRTSSNSKAGGVKIGAANIPTTSVEPSFHLSAVSRSSGGSSGGSVNAIYRGSGSTENEVQRVTFDTNTGKVTNAQSIKSGVVANEFGGFSPVENGKELPMSVPAPTNTN